MKQVSSAPSPPSFLTAVAAGVGGRVNWLSAFVGFAVGLVIASVAWVQILPSSGGEQAGELLYLGPEGEVPEGFEVGPGGRVVREGGSGGAAGSAGAAGEVGQAGGGRAGTSGGAASGGGGSVAGAPPGSVTSSLIKLGATHVAKGEGIGGAFLGEVRFGMDAVVSKVNLAGGIKGTGRLLQIIYKQDSWDASRGQGLIENLIKEEKVFALAVSPSSEGLNAASKAGLFEDNGVPVVGADGLNNTQFLDRWIWPVASATTTQVHVILKDACDRFGGANCANLRPAIVFGNTYRFGVEGAFAFNGAYCRATAGNDNAFSASGACSSPGKNIPGFTPGGTLCQQGSRFCGIDANQGQFPQEIGKVKDACNSTGIGGGRCNFIMLLLEPATALKWMGGFGQASDFGEMAGAQPLFTSNFAFECRFSCHGMSVWTGYNPPVGAYASSQKVADYVRELKAASNQTADEFNQFTMGGYIGMSLLVDALERVGKDLTRQKLVDTLNSMPPLVTGLTNPAGLQWNAGVRYANHSAQSFRIDYSNRFNGFVPQTPYTKDPWLGKDNRLP